MQRLPKGRGEDGVHVNLRLNVDLVHEEIIIVLPKPPFCAFESLHRYVMLDLKLIIQ